MPLPRTCTTPAFISLSSLALALIAGCSSTSVATRAPEPAIESQLQPEPALVPPAGANAARQIDPFAHPGASQPRNTVFAARSASEAVTAPRPPQFAMFGDVPNTAANHQDHSLPFDSTENIRQVSFGTEGEDYDPRISRDGDFIYFASTRHRPTADIYVKSVHGTSITQLTSDPGHDVMPAISPDGKRIAFASNRNGSWDIYVMNAEGGQAVQVTSDTSDELHPTWSPEGNQIAYSRLGETSDRWEIWVTDLSKPNSYKFLTFGLFPEWHPTDSKILFQRSRDRGDRLFSVWTIDYTRGEAVNPTELISSPVAAVINPSWSPDGAYVAVSTIFNPGETPTGTRPEFADIWILRADGSTRTNLTNGWFVNLMPTWGPGNQVYFVSDRNGYHNIWEIGSEQAQMAAGSFTGNADVARGESSDTQESDHNTSEPHNADTSVANVEGDAAESDND